MALTTVAAALAAAGCAGYYSGSTLKPGVSTAADVEATMGHPAERIALRSGDSLWEYPRGPEGRQTYSVRVGRDGVVRRVSQVLTIENLAKLRVGQSTPASVERILGPPVQVSENHREQRAVWEYDMYADTRPVIVYVQFDPQGLLREVLQVNARSSSEGD
jgi:hypothetical protein